MAHRLFAAVFRKGVYCPSCILAADWLEILVSRDSPIVPGPDWLAKAAAKRGQTAQEAAKRANSAFTIVCCHKLLPLCTSS